MNINSYDEIPDDIIARVEHFEKLIGAKLSSQYRSLIISVSCGWSSASLGGSKEWADGFRWVYGLTDRKDFSLIEEWHGRDKYPQLPIGFIMIGHNGGGDIICLGIDGEHKGKIYFLDHEIAPMEEDKWDRSIPEPGSEDDWGYVLFLAETFDEFISCHSV